MMKIAPNAEIGTKYFRRRPMPNGTKGTAVISM